MKRPVSKRRAVRHRVFQKKARLGSLVQSRTYQPRTLFSTMPSEFNVAISLAQQANYNVGAGAFASFSISCGSFIGLGGVYPPYFLHLMKLFSSARIRKVYTEVSFHSIDAANESMNIATGVISQLDAANIQLNQDTMDKLRAVPGSKTSYLGTQSGGHDVVKFTNLVDIDKWSSTQGSSAAVTRSGFDAAGLFGIVQPQGFALDTAPAVTFMYTPTQALAFDFQVIRKVTYHVTFQGLHLGQT